ncbi:MAG: ABC transporter substrate-binding protein [Planctomycetes bacterium]|nr:ABC transporter substrate-binding protein [Planctomycetota bacterium]
MSINRIVACAGVLGALALLPARAPADDLVIGMSAAFKGPSRALGTELYRGAMAYFEHVNRDGGVHGRQIVIKTYDDNYNPLPCIDNTVRLIERDKVFLLFGYVGTPTVTRTLPLLKRYENRSMLLFFPYTGAEPHRQPPYDDKVFNLRASYRQETAGLVDNFVKIGRKKIAVFYQIDAYGRSGWDGVRRALERHGLQIVGEATYRRGTTYKDNLRAQVEILRKTDCDAIISIGAYAACAAFIRDARDEGWEVPIANVSFVGSDSLLELLMQSAKANQKDYTKNIINSQVVPSYHDTTLPAVRQYRELMDRYNPQPPADLREEGYRPLPYSFLSLEGFLDAKLLVELLRRMEPPLESGRIKKVVESCDQLDLGIGVPVTFGPGKHQGSDHVYYTSVSEGRFVPVTSWEKWRP